MASQKFGVSRIRTFGSGGGGGGFAAGAKNPMVDLTAFPILTEEVGYPPSPVARTGAGVGAPPSAGGLGQTALKAVADVLGWKVKAGDTGGFRGALAQAFTLTEVEGHVEAKWVPRTYAVQSDLSGGLSGAQASIYMRAKYTLDEALPLLDGLKALNPAADPEDLEALRAVVRSQMIELVGELPFAGGPRVARVTQYFNLLLGQTLNPKTPVQTNPDLVAGTLGNLRDVFGLATLVYSGGVGTPNNLVNTLDDEQDATNFRVFSDYLTSLAQSWISNLSFFGLTTKTPFFGTQLVLISRQLSVAAEMVDELRFALDSVFIGPAERQTLEIRFNVKHPKTNEYEQPLFLEDLLLWIQTLVTDEAPATIQSGGKFGVYQVLQVVEQLQRLIAGSVNPLNAAQIPPAYFSPRVTIALKTLADQLADLTSIVTPVATSQLPINPV
ncbi:MAG TPA: hypothetical protein VKF41_00195 [Bryobacteraceae bacterium]|nr:hypothetical protein [Bryobacteraceae bacterium]